MFDTKIKEELFKQAKEKYKIILPVRSREIKDKIEDFDLGFKEYEDRYSFYFNTTDNSTRMLIILK